MRSHCLKRKSIIFNLRLVQACEQNNTDFKESALLTLGYIGEECEENVISKFTGQILNSVQNGVISKKNSEKNCFNLKLNILIKKKCF